MKTDLARRSSNQNVGIFVIVGLIIVGATAFAAVPFSTPQPDGLTGITFANSVTDADRMYLQTSLQLLQDNLPEWYDYVIQTKPFALSVGNTTDSDWVAAEAVCCDERGNGFITFEDHFDRVATSDSSDQTTEANRIAFSSMLIHELTHLRDYRAGHMPARMDAATCITSEGAAYAKEFEFKRAVVKTRFSDMRSGELYRQAAEKQLVDDEEQFNTNFWKLYCILTHFNIGD
ncbi:MAG: hypothetical protein HZB51_12555 [Chloroflexi bacterium]|nr:hypothetical protein [Chloroflexota bacterium]